jgi:hypothetical protein
MATEAQDECIKPFVQYADVHAKFPLSLEKAKTYFAETVMKNR